MCLMSRGNNVKRCDTWSKSAIKIFISMMCFKLFLLIPKNKRQSKSVPQIPHQNLVPRPPVPPSGMGFTDNGGYVSV